MTYMPYAITFSNTTKTVRNYRRYLTRPSSFRLNSKHPLAQGLIFAGLGANAGSDTYFDSSGKGNHGTIVNDPNWITDWGRSGLNYLNSSNQYIELPKQVSRGLIQPEATIHAIVTRGPNDVTGPNIIMEIGDNSNGVALAYRSSGNKMIFRAEIGGVSSPELTSTTLFLEDSDLVVVTGVLSASKGYLYLYINGVKEDSDVVSAGTWSIPNDLCHIGISLGAYIFGNYPWEGKILDTCIWNRALSQSEIQELADPDNIMLSDMIVTEKRHTRASRNKRVARVPARATSQRPETFQLDYDHPLAQDLVFAGLGNNAGSDIYYDSSLYKNHGTLIGSTWTKDNGINCIKSDSITDIITLNKNIALSNEYSISVNVLPLYLAGRNHKLLSGSGDTSGMWISATETLRHVVGSYTETSATVSVSGDWHQICLTRYDSGLQQDWYVDGSFFEHETSSANDECNFSNIGNTAATDEGWIGTIGDIMLWTRILSSTEIRQLADTSNVMLNGLIREPSRRSSRIVVPKLSYTPTERPAEFELEQDHPLAKGLIFAGLGAHAGARTYIDSSINNLSTTPTATFSLSHWEKHIKRMGTKFTSGISNDCITVSDIPSFTGQSNFSVAAWIKPLESFGCYFLGTSVNTGWYMRVGRDITSTENGQAFFKIDDGTNDASNFSGSGCLIDDGNWHHVCLVVGGSRLYGYVDGKKYVDEDSSSVTTIDGSMEIGRVETSFEGQAIISDVMVYNISLNNAMIQKLSDLNNVMYDGLIRPINKKYFPGVNLNPVKPKIVYIQTDSKTIDKRPDEFELDYSHPLARNLLFAGLGSYPGSYRYHNSASNKIHGEIMDASTEKWFFSKYLGRRTLYLLRDNYETVECWGNFNPTYPKTISAWCYALSDDDAIGNYPIAIGNSNLAVHSYLAVGWYAFSTSVAKPSVIGRNESFDPIYADVDFGLNVWFHVTGVYENATSRLMYINGIYHKNDTSSIPELTIADIVRLNGTTGDGPTVSNGMHGYCADCIIWDRVLSPSEIRQIADPANFMLSGLIKPVGSPYHQVSRNTHKRYWVGTDYDWSKSHNWAYGPAQEGGAGIPTINDDVILE